MMKRKGSVGAVLLVLLSSLGVEIQAQEGRGAAARRGGSARSSMTGVYRIDIPQSDKLYSVVAGASSNLPFGEQQRFFIDLAVRLTPPDLLAIEREGRRVTIGSSRAPRVTLVADGTTHVERARDGHMIQSRISVEPNRVTFTSTGRTEDNFSVMFTSIDNGKRLRVTRRISAEQLNEPVIIQTIYTKISDTARWDIYGETPSDGREIAGTTTTPTPSARAESTEAEALRDALREWVEATNARDIERQISFYMPQLKAFYLARNTPRSFVRVEKARVFARADLIDIRAEEPEIIFQDAGRTAIMRFRKQYRVDEGSRSRRGEVVQELRWQKTGAGWKIFSERDVRVIR
ncbi:MAG TPA: nuclear transport factor 2 family protein [Pyrinomonadaceae bacterium]|jgi:ketosteroid isomerase-like protein